MVHIRYFVHNLDFSSTSRKNFRPQTSDDETVLADQTDYAWDTEWSHPLFIIITTDISRAATTTVSLHKTYVRVTPLTIDATPLSNNTKFNDRTGNKSLNSTFKHTQETLMDLEVLHNKIFKPITFY